MDHLVGEKREREKKREGSGGEVRVKKKESARLFCGSILSRSAIWTTFLREDFSGTLQLFPCLFFCMYFFLSLLEFACESIDLVYVVAVVVVASPKYGPAAGRGVALGRCVRFFRVAFLHIYQCVQ